VAAVDFSVRLLLIRRMAVRPAPQVALVCLTLVAGALAVLMPVDASVRASAWPRAPLPPGEAPDSVIDALARKVLQRSPAWRAQIGAVVEGATLSVSYAAIVPAGTPPPRGYAWHPIPRGGGSATIRAAVVFLRDRLDRDPVAFRLLPHTFTLSDLQQVYELLLERRLHKASFRRTLLAAHVVEPTDAWRSEGRGRPAQLFRFSPRRRRGVQRAVRFELLG
jgi:ADP-ribose pyrophosphatase YjhB (NUDIX family)